MKRTLIGAAIILGILAMSAPAWSAGGGSDGGGNSGGGGGGGSSGGGGGGGGGGSSGGGGGSGNSGGGGSAESSQASLYQQAKKLIGDEQYAKAIPLLQKSIQQKGEYADALNLLGYANRKLGDKAKAMTYYTKALNKEPNHLGANEYMGELYLEMNNLAKAEERLSVLKNACGDCDEFDDLEDEIEDYKEEHGLS